LAGSGFEGFSIPTDNRSGTTLTLAAVGREVFR
jgi:hypothetical protein